MPPLALALHGPAPQYELPENSLVALKHEIVGASVTKNPSHSSIIRTFATRTSQWSLDNFRHVAAASQSEMKDEVKQLEAPFTLCIALDAKTGRKNYLLIPQGEVEFSENAYRFELGEAIGKWQRVTGFHPLEAIGE